MTDLKAALGTAVDRTVFRKLRELDYLTSYSHRGRFYTLRETAVFDERGLWSCRGVRFSRFGSLLDTAAAVVTRAEAGYRAAELAAELAVSVTNTLLDLVWRGRVAREPLGGGFLYVAAAAPRRRVQRALRRAALARSAMTTPDARAPGAIADEMQAPLLQFYSLLDEQQRRLFAGLESLRRGRGSDRQVAALLGLDPHTVGRGRQALAAGNVRRDRVRRPGGGRPRLR